MKRTALKRKTPLKAKSYWKTKRKGLRKKSKTPQAKLKEELMAVAKRIVKKRDGKVCCTCGATELEGKNRHAGHFIRDSVGGVELRYHLKNIHVQCFRCNIILGGNEAEYYRFMIGRYGQEEVDEIFKIKNETHKWTEVDYRNKIKHYQQLEKEYD